MAMVQGALGPCRRRSPAVLEVGWHDGPDDRPLRRPPLAGSRPCCRGGGGRSAGEVLAVVVGRFAARWPQRRWWRSPRIGRVEEPLLGVGVAFVVERPGGWPRYSSHGTKSQTGVEVDVPFVGLGRTIERCRRRRPRPSTRRCGHVADRSAATSTPSSIVRAASHRRARRVGGSGHRCSPACFVDTASRAGPCARPPGCGSRPWTPAMRAWPSAASWMIAQRAKPLRAITARLPSAESTST